MKSQMKIYVLSSILFAFFFASCEVDTYGPGPSFNDLKGGTTNLGGNAVFNSTANINGGTLNVYDNATVNKINLSGGTLNLSGNAVVTTEINVKDGTVLTMADNSQAGKINMSGGTAYLYGNATINTELNFNHGSMYIGKDFATTGVVTIKGNFNVSAPVRVEFGTLLVEGDLNGIGNVTVLNGATLTVLGSQNQ